MRILHYALGFPPYRTGGLTKYCIDLMSEQRLLGHDVAMLWPGRIRVIDKHTNIIKRKIENGIYSFEIINPLPVPLDEGIIEPKMFMKRVKGTEYYRFLISYKPDVIHIHTLMGLHKEFLVLAKKLKIRLVFTAHDYFGLCPKVTFFCKGKICDGCCDSCVQCNARGLSKNKIFLLQHPVYRKLKDSFIVKKMRHKHRNVCSDVSYVEANNRVAVNVDSEMYVRLRNYYIRMLQLMDMLHFNSSLTADIYKKYCKFSNSRIINITHGDIKDHRKKKDYSVGKLKITYLSPAKPYKGYNRLISALDKIWDEGHRDFDLNVYSECSDNRKYLCIHGRYQYSDLDNIFNSSDIVVAPSACNETFGFTVLEALSYGVPVVISDTVGAKDIVGNKYGIITNDLFSSLKDIIENKSKLEQYNDNICSSFKVKTMQEHTLEIANLYSD